MDSEFEYISAAEAAAILGASRFSVARMAIKGQVRAVKIANRWLVSYRDVEELAKTYVPKVGRPRRK